MAHHMRLGLLMFGLAALLGLPVMAEAQVAPRQSRADIVYLYRMEPFQGGGQGSNQRMQGLIQAMAAQHPNSRILLFRDITDPTDYVVVIADQASDAIPGSGWSKDLVKLYSPDFSAARAFVLDSTLLVGDHILDATQSSFIQIEHVDSDPAKREATLPLFGQLEQEMRKQPGFKDLQVWTWTARTNHWTVIQVWDSQEASRKAAYQPGLIRIWDQLYGNAAAPNSFSEFRLMTSVEP